MKKLSKMTFILLAVGLFAGPALNIQADSLNSKDAVSHTVIATPAKAKISGQPVNAGAYSSKVATPDATVAAPAKPNPSSQPVNASAYSSKVR